MSSYTFSQLKLGNVRATNLACDEFTNDKILIYYVSLCFWKKYLFDLEVYRSLRFFNLDSHELKLLGTLYFNNSIKKIHISYVLWNIFTCESGHVGVSNNAISNLLKKLMITFLMQKNLSLLQFGEVLQKISIPFPWQDVFCFEPPHPNPLLQEFHFSFS